jgi:hypothetical protein
MAVTGLCHASGASDLLPDGSCIMAIEITHVRLSSGHSGSRAHHRLQVEEPDLSDGSVKTSSKGTLVDWIDNEDGKAYVGSGSQRVSVGTVHPQGGTPYLRTYSDGEWTNNFLALPSF